MRRRASGCGRCRCRRRISSGREVVVARHREHLSAGGVVGDAARAFVSVARSSMNDHNANARLEALSDGVFAIAMTLLVIEVRAPNPESIHSAADLRSALWHAVPTIGAF